jgi:hypothetical protein
MNPFAPSWLCGLQLIAVKKLEYSWAFSFERGGSLGVESLWRLVSPDGIVITSTDHSQQFGMTAPVDAADVLSKAISDAVISSVTLAEGTSDLFLHFSSLHVLQIFNTSCGYESWQLVDPSGVHLIAQGGGQLAQYKDVKV